MLLHLLYTSGHEYCFESYLLLLFSLFVLMIISKHYSTYTVSLHLCLKSFLSLHISHKIRFKSKIHSRKDKNNSKDEEKREESKLDTRGDEERRKTRKNGSSSSVHPKVPFVVLVRYINSI